MVVAPIQRGLVPIMVPEVIILFTVIVIVLDVAVVDVKQLPPVIVIVHITILPFTRLVVV